MKLNEDIKQNKTGDIEESIARLSEEIKRSRRNSQDRRSRSGRRSDDIKRGYFQRGEKIDEDIFNNDLENAGIVDSGCPTAVMGKPWYKVYESGLKSKGYRGDFLIKETNENFKFGDGPVYKATEKVNIPVQIGSFKTKIEACIVDCDVPLLVSKSDLKSWKASHNHENDVLTIGITGDF